MQSKKKSISAIKKGMNRDTHVSQVGNIEYFFVYNGNTSGESGEGLNVTNEPSNRLAVIFPEGFKVIHNKTDYLKNRTYFFLTNPTTKKSKLGYVDVQLLDFENNDELSQCDDCSQYNELPQGLEEVNQTPHFEFVELLNDECLDVGEGFNFDINFPIKKSELKQEKLGTFIYFNDYKNPPRYLNLSALEENTEENYLFQNNIPCDDITYSDCWNPDRLLIFPKHNRLIVRAEKEEIGGNLKMGSYEFYVAYCDLLGNEMVEYSTPTQPIKIFDENNNILSETETDSFTNFAIRLKVEGLSPEYFDYYKVVCVERNNVNTTQSPFVVGVYPTTDDTILFTHSGSYSDELYLRRGNVSIPKRIDFSTLSAIKPTYEKAKGTMQSGSRLWHYGLKAKEEMNLQPVVNLFGSLLKWQTAVAKEDLYKSSIATSKYVGWRRDEVEPFSIRFILEEGGYTANFPLINRPLREETVVINENITLIEDDTIIDDENQASVSQLSSCQGSERNKRWQIFNTASVLGSCSTVDEGTTIEQTVTELCEVGIVDVIPAGTTTLTIEQSETYTDLKTFVNENPELNIPEITPYLTDTYEQTCTPNFNGQCEDVNLLFAENYIDLVQEEQSSFNYRNLSDYSRTNKPASNFCNVYKVDQTTGQRLVDTLFQLQYMGCDDDERETVFIREGDFQNENCTYAVDLTNRTQQNQISTPIYHNYYGGLTISSLQQTFDVEPTAVDTNFTNKLHKGALFFKGYKNNREKVILEATQNSICNALDDIGLSVLKLRYTVYDNCNDMNVITGGIFNVSSGFIIELDGSLLDSEFIVALDAPIIEEDIQVEPCNMVFNPPVTEPTLETVYRVEPPCGCLYMFTRDAEFSSVTVSWDSIAIAKRETYEATCEFVIPKVDECNPQPYQVGEFGYWESNVEYPNNKQLYDSSELVITEDDLSLLMPVDKELFENYYTDGTTNGNYNLVGADFRCQKIRHFKFPDNRIAPFTLSDINVVSHSDAIIFPLGINLDSNIVKTILIVALNNNLITQKEFDSIQGYEIMKGDNSIHKSVIASGLGFDMYRYQKDNKDWWYSNFPFNDLGKDKVHLTQDGGALIDHPFGGESNHMFSFLSPDLLLTKPSIPTEVSLQGFLAGNSKGRFAEVEEHPKWTVLGDRARKTATTLAVAEFALETATKVSELVMNSGLGHSWFIAGLSSGTNAVGSGVSAGALATYIGATLVNNFVKIGQYRYQWLRTFRDLGIADNLASYYVAEGKYNRFITNTNTADYLRGLAVKKYLKDDLYKTVDEFTGEEININNWVREYSTLLSTGENYPFFYDSNYYSIDNNNLSPNNSSKVIASEIGCQEHIDVFRNIASPYFTLKNYIPDQWGTVDSIKWLSTNNIFYLDENTTCTPMFGGSTYISRFSWKRKQPIFRTTAMGLADKLPFNYSKYTNVGFPRFFCDYETGGLWTDYFVPFPDITSNHKFDCETGRTSFYLKQPSKIYLYYYGIVDFLVESEINCNFRYGKPEKKDQFYPQVGDTIDWTQEKNTPISTPNTFYYNNIYSQGVSNTPYKFLDFTYDKEIWKKRTDLRNGVIYSEMDNNENSIVDNWLVYKPLNFYEFKSVFGELVDLKDIESNQFLARFEDKLVMHNAIDNLVDKITPQNKDVGTAGIFSVRPLEFKSTDLGFAGTQHTDMCSTPYGHFSVDAKRGRIFQIDQNGKDMQIISESVGGQPTNMKEWFREHLPMKILRDIPNLDVDSKYKGIGFNIWYDDRFSRVFFTKRDYKVKVGVTKSLFSFNEETKQLFYNGQEVFFNDEELFEDVSFTIAYKPTEGTWNSYFSFTPDYSAQYGDFFQVGYNNSETLWSHFLDNSSFQVFQGQLEPFIVEYPVANENVDKVLAQLSLNIEVRRYQNKWDFSVWKDKGFNKLTVWNQTNHSGELTLVPQKTSADLRNYPKTNGNTQEILFTSFEGKHNINYFYNRIINQNNNIPMWIRDANNINKQTNYNAVSFKGKSVLERMRGEMFAVTVKNDNESRFKIILKNSINTEII